MVGSGRKFFLEFGAGVRAGMNRDWLKPFF